MGSSDQGELGVIPPEQHIELESGNYFLRLHFQLLRVSGRRQPAQPFLRSLNAGMAIGVHPSG